MFVNNMLSQEYCLISVVFRLAASEADRINEAEESEEDSLDDVDAATAMLELKHGQTGSNSNHETYSREYVQQKYIRKRSKMRGGVSKTVQEKFYFCKIW